MSFNYETIASMENTRGRNDRYYYEKILFQGKEYFYKRMRDDSPELREGIKREKVWSDFMLHVSQSYPQAKLKGPQIAFLNEDDGVAMNFIDAPHLSDHRDLASWQDNIERYAEMLFILDAAASGYVPTGLSYDYHRTRDTLATWDRWLGEHKHKVLQLDDARNIVIEYGRYMTLRMQHGDLTPWQIFDDNGIWIIYDGEKCGDDLARYNDLAYGYGRLATLLRSPESAAKLLRTFIERSGEAIDSFSNQFLPVMTGRAIGMLSDAFRDQQTDDYVDYAQALLDTVLSKDINRLV